MNFYLIDDDRNILLLLKQIILNRQLGHILGMETNPLTALKNLTTLDPNIVLVDLLMPEMDGITLIKRIKKSKPDAAFIMLSQVSDKEMVAKAYEAGVEFFIQKPINAVEVESVIKKVSQNRSIQGAYDKIKGILNADIADSSVTETTKENPDVLKALFQRLGIASEIGCKDIQETVLYLVEKNQVLGDVTLSEVLGNLNPSPKSMEQRIRRTAMVGLTHLAHLGLDDFGNEDFSEFASSLYGFDQVRKEMDFLKGTSKTHGNIKMRTFINSLINYYQENM